MPPESQDPNANESSGLTIEELQRKLDDQAVKIKSLEGTKSGLLADLRKKKTVESLIKAAGIDLNAENFEDQVIQAVTALRTGPGTTATSAQEPQQQAPGQSSGETPSEAVDSALRAQLSALQTQVSRLTKENEQKDEMARKEKELRRKSILQSRVVQELEKADCKRPSHVYKLLEEKFHLLDDDETAVFGSTDDPITLRDAATKLREDEEYSIYFGGSGASGSGLPASRTTIPMSNNPFAVGSANATEAARIMTEDPSKGRRLMQDARLAGKLDPIIGRALSAS